MELVMKEGTTVDVSVIEFHFAFPALVVLPSAREAGMVSPGDRAASIASSSLPVAFVGGVLEDPVLPRQAILVLHGSVAAWSTILEGATVLVPVFEIDHSQTTQKIKFCGLLTYRDARSRRIQVG